MADITSADEQLLLQGVKKAVSLVDGGDSPNDAMFKMATELKLSPGFLKAACTAFNTGRQLAQMQANTSVLDKLASFPLADFSAIHRRIWGDNEKTAADCDDASPAVADYAERRRVGLLKQSLPRLEKTAEQLPSQEKPVDVIALLKKAEAQLETARHAVGAAENQVNFRVHQLKTYFKKMAMDRLPLAQVEHAAVAMYGEPGREIMEHAAVAAAGEKRASDHSPLWSGFAAPVDRSQAPYTFIAEAIKAARQVKQARDNHAAAEQAFIQARQAVTDRAVQFQIPRQKTAAELYPAPTSLMAEPVIEKAADVFGAIDQLKAHIKGQGDSAVEKQMRELDSPAHINELRKIRAQTALTSLMSDPDSPLSEQDPAAVLSAYNELTQLAPSLSDQPAALRPMLQRTLVGNTEPFEVGETLRFEGDLQKTHSSPSLLKKIGTSLLD